MKKSWIIVLAFVFLWSAVPAFSVPVPSTLCLQWSSHPSSTLRLLLESKGKIGGVEYFDVTGSYAWVDGGFLLKGSAHRQGKKVLHLGLTGTYDGWGPGGGGLTSLESFDVRYNLKREKGVSSWLSLVIGAGNAGTDPLKAVDCSSLPKPGW